MTDVPVLTSPLLSALPGVRHAFFTRRGGVSEGLYATLNVGSGSLFSLPGTVTLGLQHPIAIAMVGIFAVGASSTAVAGERARGTLEVLLARPLSRL